MSFCHLQEIYPANIGKAIGCWIRCLKNCFLKVVDKRAEVTGELAAKKIEEKL